MRRRENSNQLQIVCVHLPLKFDGDCSYVVWIRTFLLFLPFLLLRNELLVGNFSPLFCKRDNDDVEEEKDDVGVALRRRGSELLRGASFTFSFTLNIVNACLWFYRFFVVELYSFFQCQQVSKFLFFRCLFKVDWFTSHLNRIPLNTSSYPMTSSYLNESPPSLLRLI